MATFQNAQQTKSKFLERSIQESRPIHRKCGHPHPPDWSPQFARGRGLKTKRAPLKYWRELHWDVGGYPIGLALPINFSTSRVCASTLCARVFPSWILHVPRPCANQRPLEISVHSPWTAQRSNRRDGLSSRLYRIVVADHQWNHQAANKSEKARLIQAPYIGKRRARGFVEDAETSERRLPPTHDISRLPDEEPCEETPRGSSSEITGNREEID